MAIAEYLAMEPSELEDKLVESRKELFNLRFQKATGQLDNTARIGHVKKEIARILTVLRQEELGIESPAIPVAGLSPAADTTPRRRRRSAVVDEGGAEEEEEAEADEDEADLDEEADEDDEEDA
jgi:large subunit ribosomal protein L29